MPDTVLKNLSVLIYLILTQTYHINTFVIPICSSFCLFLTLPQWAGENGKVSGLGNKYWDKKMKRATSCWPGPLAAE